MRLARLVLTTFCLVALFAVGAAAAEKPVSLFNGENLDGWGYYLVDPNVGMDEVFSVADGVLTCQGEPMGYLCTDGEYENFRLVVEWRWPEEPGNSGVLMRIDGEPKALPHCVEAQLKHECAGDIYGFHGFSAQGDPARCRTIKGHKLGGDVSAVSKMKCAEKPLGEWNRFEITLVGDQLTLEVNDVEVNRAEGVTVRPGKIGLQSEGGKIEFRKVELTPIEN